MLDPGSALDGPLGSTRDVLAGASCSQRSSWARPRGRWFETGRKELQGFYAQVIQEYSLCHSCLEPEPRCCVQSSWSVSVFPEGQIWSAIRGVKSAQTGSEDSLSASSRDACTQPTTNVSSGSCVCPQHHSAAAVGPQESCRSPLASTSLPAHSLIAAFQLRASWPKSTSSLDLVAEPAVQLHFSSP